MHQIYNDAPIPPPFQKGVVAIGNFDGVHIGHQALFHKAKSIAAEQSRPLITLTFDPHPRTYFRPETPPFLLTPGALKYDRLSTCMVDLTLTACFDVHLAEKSANDFINQILVHQLNAAHVVVGDDFHFGHNRQGTIDTIHQSGIIAITPVPLTLDHAGIPYSSTRIRAAVQDGHISDANAMLGWDFEIRGIIQPGDQRGRVLGYPTLNLDLGETLCPAHGIYAAWTKVGEDPTWHGSAVSLGTRPMFKIEKPLLEAHLFNFNRDVYGQPARVRLVQKLRDEAKFANLKDLIIQMKKDCDSARELLELKS